MSMGTLRRYAYYFKISENVSQIDSREQLIEAVEEHFVNELKIKNTEIVQRFLSTKRDPEPETYFTRGRRE